MSLSLYSMYTQKEKNLMRHETTGAQKDKSRKKRGSSSQRGDPPDYKNNPPKISRCQLSAGSIVPYYLSRLDFIRFYFTSCLIIIASIPSVNISRCL